MAPRRTHPALLIPALISILLAFRCAGMELLNQEKIAIQDKGRKVIAVILRHVNSSLELCVTRKAACAVRTNVDLRLAHKSAGLPRTQRVICLRCVRATRQLVQWIKRLRTVCAILIPYVLHEHSRLFDACQVTAVEAMALHVQVVSALPYLVSTAVSF